MPADWRSVVRQHSAIRHGHECPDVRCAAFSEVLFDVFSRRYENGATIVTSNLPFQEWTSVFASERLTGALLDLPPTGLNSLIIP